MLLALLLAASGSSDKLLAVLELQNRLPANDQLDRLYLSDRVRRAALRQVPGLRLMTRDNMEIIAKANGIDLAACDSECELVTGQKLGADLLVTGDISRFGTRYKLSLRLHEVATARLLSVGQASGATADDLDADLDQATRELFAPLRGVPVAQDAIAPADTGYLPWGFLRDRGRVGGGFAGDRNGFGWGLRARLFGAEAGYRSLSQNNESRPFGNATRPASLTSTDFYVGASPFSYGTDRDGPHGWTFTWLEPFLLYVFGNTTDTATDGSGATQTYSYSGPAFGNRFTLARRIAGPVEIRLEVEAGLCSYSFQNDLRASKVNPYLGASLALGLGQ